MPVPGDGKEVFLRGRRALLASFFWLMLFFCAGARGARADMPKARPPGGQIPGPGPGPRPGPGPGIEQPMADRDDYADNFTPVKTAVRDYERDPQNRYTYCIRTTAVYECLSYGSDGSVRRQRSRVSSHGTGFAYREQNGETLLLTNQHVTDWPQVTDSAHRVDDVPAGCKRVSDQLKIVDNEDDDYGGDDIPLSRVLVDDILDVAVVKAKARLRLLPYRIGRSALLQSGNVVTISGFPLGAFQAVNTGKVVNPYDHDEFKDWDHIDFIIDAPLSQGNSGSPVLAVSKRTGEYELVGMFHATYTRGAALNAVIGIDQLRDLMVTLKRPARGQQVAEPGPGPEERAAFELALSQTSFLPYLSLGPLPVAVRRGAGRLIFEVFSRRFPLDDRRLLILGDQPVAGAFGALGPILFGNERGLKPYETNALDGETQSQLQGVLRRIHRLAVTTLRYRATSDRATTSREAVSERAALQRTLSKEASADGDMAQLLAEMAERLGPRPADPAQSYPAVMASLLPAASPAVPGRPTLTSRPTHPALFSPSPPNPIPRSKVLQPKPYKVKSTKSQ